MGFAEMVILIVIAVCASKGLRFPTLNGIRTPATNSPLTTQRRMNPLPDIVRSWLAPTGVMAVFIVLSGVSVRQQMSSITLLQKPDVTSSTPSNAPFAHTSTLQKSNSAIPSGNVLPEWIRKGNLKIDDERRIVLSSQLWSTEEEARKELMEMTSTKIRADFAERHNSLFEKAGHRFLSDERVIDAAVKQQYLERVDQDFGKFSAPMNRLWWQIEISPAVRTELYPAWKAAVIGNRAIAVGAILALLTLLANSIALFFRLKTNAGRSGIYASSIVATSAVAWIAADLFVAKCLCQ